MAMRSVLSRVSTSVSRSMESTRGATRYFSDGKGRVLGEEERDAVKVYIKKMEKERLEMLRQNREKKKAEKAKENGDKKPEGTHQD